MKQVKLQRRYLIMGLLLLVIGVTAWLAVGSPGRSLLPQDLKRIARFTVNYNYPWVYPNVEWQVSSPASQRMDESKLDSLQTALENRKTNAFLVVRGGKIVYEWYAPGTNPNRALSVASLAKAIVGSMALMVAMDSGRIDLDDYAAEYIPQWRDDPLKATITVRHLATHSSGIDSVDFTAGARGDLEGWKREYFENSTDRFAMALTRPKVNFTPGSEYSYSVTGYYALAYVLTTSLQESLTPDIRTLLEQRVMQPIGVPDEAWKIGYGKKTRINGMELYAIGSGGSYTPRAIARVGQFMLNKGSWDDHQIIAAASVDAILGGDSTPSPNLISDYPEPQSALGWWTNTDGFWPSLPKDAFIGAGANHQVLLVVPSLDLVMVRLGGSLTGTHWGDDFWGELEDELFEPLMGTIESTN